MPPKKKAEPKPKTATKAAAKSKAAPKPKSPPKPKAVSKPKISRKPAVSEKKTAPKADKAVALKVPSMEKAPVVRKTTSSGPAVVTSPSKKLPQKGETQLIAFVRDPQCIFTYWEVTPARIEEVKRQLQGEFKNSSMVLRVYHMEGPDGAVHLVQEIFVEPNDMNRYVEVDSGTGKYFFEIAQKTSSGRLVVYARSNPIQMGFSPAWGESAAPEGPAGEMPSGLQDYFSQEEYAEILVKPGGPSSAGPLSEAMRKKKGRYFASNV